MMMEAFKDEIVRLKENGLTNIQVAEFLKNCQTTKGEGTYGLSERSVRRFCQNHGIGRQPVTDRDLRTAVDCAVEQNGPSYGRKMMTGFLSAQGMKVAEARVGKVLRESHPPYHHARLQGARNINPIPYFAQCFGHKMHMDQNEKLSMFGITHVLAIDGYSSKVVGWSSMPIKNNLLIYDNVYRSAVLENGMWDQVRVDHGAEFYLTLYMQEKNTNLRVNCNRQPYIQTKSTRNHRIERMWPEVNQRVNYPIKGALVELTDEDKLDMDDSLVKFCVSTLCLQLCKLGVGNVVASWNAHRIPGRGIPNQLAHQSGTAPVTAEHFHPAHIAADWYSRDMGSTLTTCANFGQNPFSTEEQMNGCQLEVQRDLPDLHHLMKRVVNQDFLPLQDALFRLIDITRRRVA